MYRTQTEILAQPDALRRTIEYFLQNEDAICQYWERQNVSKLVFVGCGSSHMLAKSAAVLFGTRTKLRTAALAGGDFLVNPEPYRSAVQDALVVVLSRSGSTTELLRTVEYMKKNLNVKVLCITAKEHSALQELSDYGIGIPWAYDESVCQTQTVTNLYTAVLLLYAIWFHEKNLLAEIVQVVGQSDMFLKKYWEPLSQIASRPFEDVVVLADGVLCGIAQEGALAFTEIAQVRGSQFHVLDYRHGPVVLNGERTLTVVAVQPTALAYQSDLIADVKARGGLVVVLDAAQQNRFNADLHLCAAPAENFCCYGITLIILCQMLAFHKAMARGINPDMPIGLDPCIQLS